MTTLRNYESPIKDIFNVVLSGFLIFNWNFGHCDLPFDWAQGGELVEPFVICNLLFGIFASPFLLLNLLALRTNMCTPLTDNDSLNGCAAPRTWQARAAKHFQFVPVASFSSGNGIKISFAGTQ